MNIKNKMQLNIFFMFIISSSFILSSCGFGGEKSKLKYFKVTEQSFQKYINQKELSGEANSSVDKFIVNNDYPFEISLFKDGRWFYNLPNLDIGVGTWEYKEGRIHLFAKRDLFDMHIDLYALEEDATKVYIQFSDRFGPKELIMDNLNIQE